MALQLMKNKKLLIGVGSCVTLSLAFGVLTYFTYGKIEEESLAIESKKGELQTAQKKISEIPQLEKRVVILREIVKEYLQILPSSKEVNEFVMDLSGFQQETGIQITELKDANKTVANAKKEAGFDKVSYGLKVEANFWQYLAFLHRLESFRRFVRIPKLKIDAGERPDDQDPAKARHSFDFDIETYVFDPTQRAKPANIANFEKRVIELQDDIARAKEKIILEPYEFQGARGRRDPFFDPRMSVGESEGGEEGLRRQMEIVEGLRAEVARIGQMVLDYSQTKQLIRRFELRHEIEQSIEVLLSEIEKVQREGKVTYLPLVRRLQGDIMGSLREMRAQFDPTAGTDTGPSLNDLQELAKAMREHLDHGEFTLTMDRYNLVSERLKGYEEDAERGPVIRDLMQMNRAAEVAQEFEKLKLSVGGIIVSEEGSVVVINGRSFGEGDYVDEDLVVRKIHSDAIEFQYRDVVISKKI